MVPFELNDDALLWGHAPRFHHETFTQSGMEHDVAGEQSFVRLLGILPRSVRGWRGRR
jgi:hypothetical protein